MSLMNESCRNFKDSSASCMDRSCRTCQKFVPHAYESCHIHARRSGTGRHRMGSQSGVN